MKACKVSGCNKIPTKGNKECPMHKYRIWRYGSYDLPPKIEKKKKDLPIGVEKICRIHGFLTKDDVSYVQITKNRHKNPYDAIYVKCKKCHVENVRNYQRKNPTKILEWEEKRKNSEHRKKTIRVRNLKKFGLTLEKYEEKLLNQNGLCAICKQPETAIRNNKLKNLAVDHCHKKNQIRGLLCGKCNPLIGYANDDINILYNAIEYLQQYKIADV